MGKHMTFIWPCISCTPYVTLLVCMCVSYTLLLWLLIIKRCLLLVHSPPVVGVAVSSSKQEIKLWVVPLFLHRHLLKLHPIPSNKHRQLVNDVPDIRICTEVHTEWDMLAEINTHTHTHTHKHARTHTHTHASCILKLLLCDWWALIRIYGAKPACFHLIGITMLHVFENGIHNI